MPDLSRELLPQLADAFCRLGHHDDFPWTALPWPGTYNKVLYFDYATGATVELAKIEKAAEFPEHYHTTLQTAFLVSGRLRTPAGTILEPGNFNINPPGRVHGPFVAEEEAIQFEYFSSVPIYILRDGSTYVYQYDGHAIPLGTLVHTSKSFGDNILFNRDDDD